MYQEKIEVKIYEMFHLKDTDFVPNLKTFNFFPIQRALNITFPKVSIFVFGVFSETKAVGGFLILEVSQKSDTLLRKPNDSIFNSS